MKDKQRRQVSLVQEIDCPYGANTTILIKDPGNGLTMQCAYARDAAITHYWSDKKMEKLLMDSGCPMSSGRTRKFRGPECPFNNGIIKRL